MSLEEKLRAYAAKGELVHLSLVASHDVYECRIAFSSPLGGYSTGRDTDPVEAIEAALKASPVKTPRVSKSQRGGDVFTAAVIEEGAKVGGLPIDWTAP